MGRQQQRDVNRLALGIGVVAAGSAVSLATYFAAQGPFGTINDVGNASTGVLTAALAWRLRHDLPAGTGALALGAATAGAALTVVGSGLVVSGTTTFLLGGLVSSVGFAGIGAWLFAASRSPRIGRAWSSPLRRLGLAAGALMATGVVAIPGVILRLDDAATAPWWAWLGFTGWLGIYVVLPLWAARRASETRRAASPASAAIVGAG